MEQKSYFSLKSGTDVRGITVQTDGFDVTLTIEAIHDITRAFIKWLQDRTEKTVLNIAVGRDVRLSGETIFEAIQQIAITSGCNLIDCGVCTTPSMFVLLRESDWNCDASIMITASHLPSHMNGLKFFTPAGGLTSEELDEVLTLAAKDIELPRLVGNSEELSYMDEYIKKLIAVVRTGTGKSVPLFGKRIVVDASNGVGGFFVKKVLQQLGAVTDGSINLAPDGNFPAHAPNPENPEAINALAKAVKKVKADLGIIFDTDVDRAALVDGSGKLINRDNLIALTAATVLTDRHATIVTDSVTTDGLREFIESHGGKQIRFKRGYKNVIEEAKRRNARGEYCPLAIETSGHAAFKDNYFLDDGAYLVCKLLVAYAAQSLKKERLTDLISDLKTPLEEAEVRIKFNDQSTNFKQEGKRIINEFGYFATIGNGMEVAPDNYEGVRVNFCAGNGDGWTLVRQSVHEPVLPINFASREEGGVKKMAKQLYYMMAKYPFLDTENLKNLISKK